MLVKTQSKTIRSMRIPFKDNLIAMQSETVLDFFSCRDTEVLVSGPRNCAKSMAMWLRTLALHEKHPRLQSVVVRAEMKSISDTVIPQLFNKVFKYPPGSRKNPFELYGGINRPQHIQFSNGGRMTFGGMDDPGKVLGGEYDLIIYNQPERERREKAWLDLIGCGEGGRGGNWIVDGEPFFQIMGDANPDAKTHWLMGRVAQEMMRHIKFTHRDNPLLFYDGDWTTQGVNTREGLKKRFTGYMLRRMVYGEWCAAEGVVYNMFNNKELGLNHLKPVKRIDIPDYWKWYMSIDYGSNNPSVCQLWACDPNAQKHILFREAYMTGLHITQFLPYIQGTVGDESVQTIFGDHDSGHNDYLRDQGYHVTDAQKKNMKLIGIDKCKELLSEQDRVIINSNSLWHGPDPELDGKAQCTADEFPLYSYKEEDRKKGDHTDEEPLKKWDHGMDAFRNYVVGVENYVPYEFVYRSSSLRRG